MPASLRGVPHKIQEAQRLAKRGRHKRKQDNKTSKAKIQVTHEAKIQAIQARQQDMKGKDTGDTAAAALEVVDRKSTSHLST